MIYCTRYKDETIPVGASMSQEAYEKLKKDYEDLYSFFNSDPSKEEISAKLGKEDAMCGNIRKLENNPSFVLSDLVGRMLGSVESKELSSQNENIFSGESAGLFMHVLYNKESYNKEYTVEYVRKELELSEKVYYRQILSDIFGDISGNTYYYYDGWLKVVYGSDGNYLYSTMVEPITKYTDPEVVSFVNGEWDNLRSYVMHIAVPHTDKYIEVLLNANK